MKLISSSKTMQIEREPILDFDEEDGLEGESFPEEEEEENNSDGDDDLSEGYEDFDDDEEEF